jgi:signal transduction histidine kinase/ActR/RegA family two-component response regulator
MFDLIFPREYLRAALVVSLLSVWVLVFLFYYLNRYTQRRYFTIWTAAWLFYALWLTLGITVQNPAPQSIILVLRQWCVGISAVFLLWGSLQFLGIPTNQTVFGLFMGFLLVWSYASPMFIDDPLLRQTPIFSMIGLASMFAALSFYRVRKRRQFVGVGLLFFGFLLWGLYLVTYPISQKYQSLTSAGFLVSAVLQLFIAVSMIVLVLEEARHLTENVLEEIQSVKSEREALQMRVLSTEAERQTLFDRARLHEDLQKAYDELRQTQHSVMQQERLRALGEMASGIAHDINNALSPVMAFSDLILQREPALSQNARRNLTHIRTAGEDIAQIVARMGEFYRRRENRERLTATKLNRICAQVIDMTSPRWQDMAQSQGTNVNITTDFEPELPELYGDESELREALTNLLLNAVDALPKGGTITMVTRSITLKGDGPSGTAPTHVALEIRDNGTGMDERTRQRCLEPFFSTKRDRGGTGLGLAMVYGMMERHEGTIEVESQPARGTTIRLVFPLRHIPEPSPVMPAPVPELAASLRVLYIDDEPLLRELLKEIIEHQHHQVETADGGQAGLEAFLAAKNRGEPFDLVITDLGMPHVDGRQVAQRVKSESAATPVVMLTGWGAMLGESLEVPSEVDVVLCKPPRMAELTETLVRFSGGKRS